MPEAQEQRDSLERLTFFSDVGFGLWFLGPIAARLVIKLREIAPKVN